MHLLAQARSSKSCEQIRVLISYMFDLPDKAFWCASFFVGNLVGQMHVDKFSHSKRPTVGSLHSQVIYCFQCIRSLEIWHLFLSTLFICSARCTLCIKFGAKSLEPFFMCSRSVLRCWGFLTVVNKCGSVGTWVASVGCHCMHTITLMA